MLYIIENQKRYDPDIDVNYLMANPYSEASGIYKSLYHLSADLLKTIDKIILFINDERIRKSYSKGFSKYSANANDYKLGQDIATIKEIIYQMPSSDELLNLEKRTTIEHLINNILIENISKSTQYAESIKIDIYEEALFYLPFCKETSYDLIHAIPPTQLKLFTNSGFIKCKNKKQFIFIDTNSFNETSKILDNVKQKCTSHHRNPYSFQNYKHPEMLENFTNGFFDTISQLSGAYKKRIHLYGADEYIAKRAIDRILLSSEHINFTLPKDLRNIQHINKSIVVYNLHSLQNSKDIHVLYQEVKKIDETFYVVLQALSCTKIEYFGYYEPVEVPSHEEIRTKITSLFLSLLIERRIYTDSFGWLLGLVEQNLLSKLIPEVESLEILFKAISEFEDLQIDDLIGNAAFWVYFNTSINRINNRLVTDISAKRKDTLTFSNEGDFWDISGLNDTIRLLYYTHKGVKYLVTIIKYSILYKKSADASTIRRITAKYMGDSNFLTKRNKTKEPLINLLEKDRKTISSAIGEIKRKPKLNKLKEFIEEYIKYENKSYYFDHKNQIDINIIDPLLKEEYFH